VYEAAEKYLGDGEDEDFDSDDSDSAVEAGHSRDNGGCDQGDGLRVVNGAGLEGRNTERSAGEPEEKESAAHHKRSLVRQDRVLGSPAKDSVQGSPAKDRVQGSPKKVMHADSSMESDASADVSVYADFCPFQLLFFLTCVSPTQRLQDL
jgi:hypothetical protein